MQKTKSRQKGGLKNNLSFQFNQTNASGQALDAARAYEVLKAAFRYSNMSPSEYQLECRRAARKAGL